MRLVRDHYRRKYHVAGRLLVVLTLAVLSGGAVAEDTTDQGAKPAGEVVAAGVVSQGAEAAKAAKSAKTAGAVEEPEEAASKQYFAFVTEVEGAHVQVSVDQGRTWQAAQRGMRLSSDARLRTGFGSRCEVNFGGHSVVQLEALSSLRLSDYSGRENFRRVRTKLHYGAVRCGVEKGRLEASTEIATPISTLSIRGTLVYVEYDPGLRTCMLMVDEDGPALASAAAIGRGPCLGRDCVNDNVDDRNPSGKKFDPVYELTAPMYTDCVLSRYLKLATFERHVWAVGNYLLGDISDAEADSIVMIGGFGESTDGHFEYDSDRLRDASGVANDMIDFPGGDIPVGQTQPPVR